MINLYNLSEVSSFMHMVPTDPGRLWSKDEAVIIDVPPDNVINPEPEVIWSEESGLRTGIYGAVSPRVVALPEGGYRLYYTQILPQPGFSGGANDYDNSMTRILSAYSSDGFRWIPEAGVRLSNEAAECLRVVSSDVTLLPGGCKWRMYFECAGGTQSEASTIRSAISTDGLNWAVESGTRLEVPGKNYISPRIILLDNGQWRLYCNEKDTGIISAISDDGVTFNIEPGVRITQDGKFDSYAAFASEIMSIKDGGYIMYYAGYSSLERSQILRAVSDDGLLWQKEDAPILIPGGIWDRAKCSEMSIFRLPDIDGELPRYRMFYEGCDGTSGGQRGIWRIAGVTGRAATTTGDCECNV